MGEARTPTYRQVYVYFHVHVHTCRKHKHRFIRESVMTRPVIVNKNALLTSRFESIILS